MNNSKKEDSIIIRDINENDAMDLFKFLSDLNEKTKSYFHPHSFDLKTINDICKSGKDQYFVMFFNSNIPFSNLFWSLPAPTFNVTFSILISFIKFILLLFCKRHYWLVFANYKYILL